MDNSELFNKLLDQLEIEENSNEDEDQVIIKIKITAITDGGFGYRDQEDIFFDISKFGYTKEEWDDLDFHDRPPLVRDMIKKALKNYEM